MVLVVCFSECFRLYVLVLQQLATLLFITFVHVCAAGLCVRLHRLICMSTKKQAVYCLTAWKSPAKCILLLSPWVKMPLVWFAASSELYRWSNSFFSIRAAWAPEYCITVRKVCACCSAASAENYFSFTVLSLTLTSAQSTDRAQCTQGMCSSYYM